jgi:hypothetical protein
MKSTKSVATKTDAEDEAATAEEGPGSRFPLRPWWGDGAQVA